MTTIALLTGMMISAALLLLAIRRAPRGYEDRDGFHFEDGDFQKVKSPRGRPALTSRSTPGPHQRRRRPQSGSVSFAAPFRQPRSVSVGR